MNSRQFIVGILAAAVLIPNASIGSNVALASAETSVVTGYKTPALPLESMNGILSQLTILIPHDNKFDEIPEGQLPPGALAGYEVVVSPVSGIDITDSKDYDVARELTATKARELGLSEEKFSGTTDSDGRVTFTDVLPGAYLVEIKTPMRDGFKYKKFEPMVVMLPVVGEDGLWQSEVEVKAKPEGGGEITPPTNFPNPVPSTEVPPPPNKTTTTTTNPPPVPESPRDGDAQTKEPGNDTGRGLTRLAETGASVLSVVGVGLLALITGFILVTRKRDKNMENAA